jgi:hypothetical protein
MKRFLHRQLYLLPGPPPSAGWVFWTADAEDLQAVYRPALPMGAVKASFVQVVKYDDMDEVSSTGTDFIADPPLPVIGLDQTSPFLDTTLTGTHSNVSGIEVWIDGAFDGLVTLLDSSTWEYVLGVTPNVAFDLELVVRTNGSLAVFDEHPGVIYSPVIPITIQPAYLQEYPGYVFTRASIATDGLPSTGLPADDVDTFASGELRDVSAKTGEDYWYLVEGQRINYIRQSAGDLTASPWVLDNGPTVTPGFADPAGGTAATRCEGPNVFNVAVRQELLSSIPAENVLSVFVSGGDGVRLGQIYTVNPDAAFGALTPSTWERWVVAKTTGTASNQIPRVMGTRDYFSVGGLVQGARDQVVWGAQMEAGHWASSYIPTEATTVTRVDDDLRIQVPEWWTTDVVRFEFVPAFSSAEHIAYGGFTKFWDAGLAFQSEMYLTAISISCAGGSGTFADLTWDAGDVLAFVCDIDAGTFDLYKNDVLHDSLSFATGVLTPGIPIRIGSYLPGFAPFFGLVRVLDTPPEFFPQDFRTLDGYTFTRASTATDGLPSVGLPADSVSSYGSDILRDVSTKTGEVGWFLLEGARTNLILHSAEITTTRSPWASPIGTVTSVRDESDPMGGTEASRLSAPTGINNLLQDRVGTSGVPRAHSLFVRRGPGSGVFQLLVINPTLTRGGTAGTEWSRIQVLTTSTAAGIQMRVIDTSTSGEIPSGARDYVAWGAQVEDNATFASSYIPTTGSAATRLGDDLSANLPEKWCRGILRVLLVPAYSSAQRVASGQHISVLSAYEGARLRLAIIGPDIFVQIETWDGVFTSGVDIGFNAGDEIRFDVDWEASDLLVYLNNALELTVPFTGGWVDSVPVDIGHEDNTEHVHGLLRVEVKDGTGPVFEPWAISGTRFYGDDTDMVVSGGDVVEWSDRSAVGNHLNTNFGAGNPSFGAGFNGGTRGYLECDGIGEALGRASFSWGGAPTALTFATAQHLVTNVNGRRSLVYNGFGQRPSFQETTSNRIAARLFGSTGITPPNDAFLVPRALVARSTQGGTLTYQIGGLAELTAADGSDAHSDGAAICLGSNSGLSGVWAHIRFAGLWILNRNITVHEQNAWLAYSRKNWGLPV